MEQSDEGQNTKGSLGQLHIVEPISAHTHSVIFLHGLGSNGEKFGAEFLSTAIRSDGKSLRSVLPGTRFIFPTAKRRRSSAFNRSKLTQWFDVASLEDPSFKQHTQIQGLEESFHDILDLIHRERAKIPSENILLGGLSQGGAIGIICLLMIDFPIGGFIGMSTWMPYRQDIYGLLHDTEDENQDDLFDHQHDIDHASSHQEPNGRVVHFIKDLLSVPNAGGQRSSQIITRTPVFLGHGSKDEKIAPLQGESARDTLRDIGFVVQWEAYDGQGHWYKIPEEIDDLSNFMQYHMGWKLNLDN